MEKKYLNESRYKKGTSRKRRDSKTVRSNLNTKKLSDPIKKVNKAKKIKKVRVNKKKTINDSKSSNIVICVILLIAIAVISRAILKEENEPFIPLPFFEQSNEEVIRIGVITDESLLDENNKNCVINELNKYSKDMLLEINEDYSITYRCISNVIKISNTEYVLSRNKNSKVSIELIKQTLNEYMTNKESVYYSNLFNIASMEIQDSDTLKIKLKSDMPYFIYNLGICLNTSKDISAYITDSISTKDKLVFSRHKKASKDIPAKIVILRYDNVYNAVQAYKNDEIDMFVTDAANVENILGKYEYSIKKFRNGKTVFLLSNPNSNLYSRTEVRKAIAYSIDRDKIIEEVLKSKGQKIDLPYIYDNVKYKYDVYASENLLLTSGYQKNSKVYFKVENKVKTTLELNLIVNKNDQEKVDIANIIKNNLSAVGIKINVEKLTDVKLKERISNGEYDLVLASVSLNNIPDISFIKDSLFMTSSTKQLLQIINDSEPKHLRDNIILLQKGMSEDISSIGIYSDVSYLIHRKSISGMKDISYMKLFKSILS